MSLFSSAISSLDFAVRSRRTSSTASLRASNSPCISSSKTLLNEVYI